MFKHKQDLWRMRSVVAMGPGEPEFYKGDKGILANQELKSQGPLRYDESNQDSECK